MCVYNVRPLSTIYEDVRNDNTRYMYMYVYTQYNLIGMYSASTVIVAFLCSKRKQDYCTRVITLWYLQTFLA